MVRVSDETETEKAEPCRKLRWRMRKRRLGQCIKCGVESDRPGKDYCEFCLARQRRIQLKYLERKKQLTAEEIG